MRDANTTVIDEPFPTTGRAQLKIGVGACRLVVRPGSQTPWVAGSYRDPSDSLPCRIERRGEQLEITQKQNWTDAIGRIGRFPAVFDLALGRAVPYELSLETGASQVDADLGGLPISRLSVKQGAGKLTLDFSAPNPTPMDRMSLGNGASGIEMHNLANANCAEMSIEGGVAGYRFDFGGTLQRDCQVRISTGVSGVELIVPPTTAAKIYAESVLGGIDVGDGFMKKEGAFWNEAALAGRTPVLTIRANVALGGMKIRSAGGR